MLTFIVVAILAVLLFLYVSIPLIFPKQADPLPKETDPVATELEEEREALFRAILELETREDLPVERRDSLRARYEAKAAQVLRALDERQADIKGAKPYTPKKRHTFPYVALGLLAFVLISAVVMGGYVLPRIGSGASVTTAFDEQLEAGRRLRKLQQAVNKDPSLESKLALAEAQWEIGFRFEDDEQVSAAIDTYENLVKEYSELPATAYFRLGLSQFQSEPDKALTNFNKARQLNPDDPEMLITLAEIYFNLGNLENAIELWRSYIATPEGADDETTKERLAMVRGLASKYEAIEENPNEANLMEFADTFWHLEQRQLAQYAYLRILRDYNPNNTLALSRVGQVMFIRGSTEEAITLLRRARELEKRQSTQGLDKSLFLENAYLSLQSHQATLISSQTKEAIISLAKGYDTGANVRNLNTLLFLGNAYFSLQNYSEAIAVWEEYIELAGGEDSAGRVPSLIVQARARLTGNSEGREGEEFTSVGQRLYQANCIACHGAQGEGGSAISLRGNTRLTEARVTRTIRDGKGLMPAFDVILSLKEIEQIAKFVSEEIALK